MPLPLPFLSTSAALLPGLLLLETVLSADNALALASLVKPIPDPAEREWLLNWGLATAIVLRRLAVAAAGILLHQPLVRLLGGGYLVWLALAHFRRELRRDDVAWPIGADHSAEGQPLAPPRSSRPAMVLVLAGTNLAFSLDSIAAALAMTDNLPLVMGSGTLGVVTLRWLTDWVLRWMERCPNLSNAGFLMVLAVGLRLVVEQAAPALSPPEPLMIGAIVVLLGWGLWAPQPAPTVEGSGERTASNCGRASQPS
ncbi:MAG: TerC family protein [Cyanobacteriota bacterium]